jgi:hypothetical protein
MSYVWPRTGWALTVRDKKMILPGATKESLKALPEFKYAGKQSHKISKLSIVQAYTRLTIKPPLNC